MGRRAWMWPLGLVLGMAAALMGCSGEPVALRDARLRLLPGDLPSAGYFTLHNRADQPVVLVGAVSPAFERVMLHRSVIADGQSKMRHVERVVIERGATLSMAPGGYHLMLMRPTRELALGDTVPVELRFAEGGSRTVEFTVKGATTQ